MPDNCPVGCEHCTRDNTEEAEERAEARLRKEEDDANFADQDIGEDEVASLMGVESYK